MSPKGSRMPSAKSLNMFRPWAGCKIVKLWNCEFFRVIHLYKVQCQVWCWDPVFLKVYFKVWFQDPVFPENILPGMISGSFVIKDYTVYLRPCPCISLMKALECVSASPGQILQLWCLQPKWLSQQIPPRKSVLGAGLNSPMCSYSSLVW